MIPAEIKYLLENYEADDSSLVINKADYSNNTPNLSLTLHQPGAAPQLWSLEVIGHRDSQLSFSNIIYDTTILLTDDHPLLWQYADEQCELYFNGSSKDTAKIIAELKQIDSDLFGIHQKSSGQLNILLQTSNGSLGKGSKKLLTKYAACLNKYNIKTSIIDGHIPTYSDGTSQYSGKTLKLFFIRGSYIVGQDFIFNKYD